jgi:hypothetical protein
MIDFILFIVSVETLLKMTSIENTENAVCPRFLQSTLLDLVNKDPLYKLTKQDKVTSLTLPSLSLTLVQFDERLIV